MYIYTWMQIGLHNLKQYKKYKLKKCTAILFPTFCNFLAN